MLILYQNGITISNIATKRAIGTDSEYFSDESLGQEDIAENFKECIKSIEFTNSAQQKAVYSDFDTLVNDLLDSNNTFFNNEKPLQLNLRFRDEEFLRNKALQHIANEMGTYFSINHILRLPEDKQDEIIEMCNNTEDGFDEDVERKINTEINIAYFKHSINAEKLEEKGIYISDIKTKSYIDTGINFQYDSTEDIDSAFEKNFESIEFTNSKNQKAIYRDYNSFVFDMTDSTNNFFNNGEISENEQLEFNESETQQKETDDVSKVDININNETEQPQEKEIKPKQNMNLSERLYEQFAKMFPDIVNGKHEYERYGSYDDESGYEPISVEYLGGSEYGFMTSYLQNGDVMRDPDFTFELDHENRTLTIHEYQQDGTPFGTLYQRVFDDNMNPDYDLLNSLGKNLMLNLKNAESANRPLTVYDDKNEQSYINVAPQISEETVNDDFSEEIIEPEIIVPQTPYSRISANISAIRELKRLERAEAEGLSEDEIYDKRSNQYNSRKNSDERLRGYSGWGGLSKVFDESSNNWQNREIQNLLTPDEYNAAKESTLNAHYTPEFIIDSMYKAIKNMELPRNSRILEPSCGVGRFISHMPSSLGNTEIVGVELDSITARIAKQLNKDNSNVRIINSGFEDTKFENGSFDLAIGNIPFGDYNLNDPDHAQNWRIHDAFFRKALDKVAAGGMVAFITSCGTLDKKNPKVREYLATQAELVGAIRLPDNAFSSAGTKTPTDIIFLKKRENPLSLSDRKPDWCYTTKNSDGLNINSYFIKNPQMILGKMEKTTHFDRLTCKPLENADIEKQLDEAIKNLNAKITVEKRESRIKEQHKMIEAWGKNYTFQVKNDTVYYRIGEEMKEIECSEIQKSMIEKLCNIRNITRQLLDMQKTPVTDEQLIPLRNELNNAYDQFVKEHGNLINKEIKRIFKDDSDFPIIQSLEKINSETEAIEKSDIFYRRTVNPIVDIKEVNTLEEAMQISLDRKGKPDILYMATLLSEKYPNKSISDVAEIVCNELLDKEYIFIDPEKQIPDKAFSGVTEKSEYLSGNVRMKLVMAQEHAKTNPEFERNVKALEKVIPEDIKAEEISVQMGCTWIDEEDYTDFLTHLSGRSSVNSRNCEVTYSAINGEYSILKAGSKKDLNVNETSTYGTADMSMYKIAERLLNQRRIVVMQYLPNPDNPNKKIARTDPKATKLAMEKAKLIKAEFKKWIFADPIRKEKYERRYNDIFNSLVGRSYDGSHLTFSGMKTGFNLRPHQKDCIARAIYGGNTLAAHVVGAGKSAVMFSTVMKKKELGLINKACVVVPKALTEQTASEWHRIFPDAKLLTVTNEDLATEEKRRLFTARVATGSYDAVIMSQEQFEKIPMSREYRIKFLQKEADALEDMLREKKSEGRGKKDATVLAIQAAKKKLITKINSLVDSKSASKAKDDLLEFEHLGFDYLVCDEAHAYKNGFVLTKMQNVAGVTTKASGRAEDMQMKTDYFNEQLGNGHILFCTGTPVSNSMTELYVMTRYLRPDLLEQTGVSRFDDWAATFGTVVCKNQQAADGTLKMRTSFSSFANLPELMAMYKEFADIQSAEKLNLPRPELKTGGVQIVKVTASPEQKQYVKDLAERAKLIEAGVVTPEEDNLLKITGEARLIGLGNKAIKALYNRRDEELPYDFIDSNDSKVDKCIENVARIYNETSDTKGVQIIFSDIAVNSDKGNFSAYDYIKSELSEKYKIPENEIIFAPKSDSKERENIFRDINNSKYRIVIASTETLGTGANIQNNLYALHHLDIPWKPSDFEQREGRILRQGNKNSEVEIFNYVTSGTLDSYLYQTVLDKARFIAQLMDDKCPARVSADCDEKVLTFGELQAASEDNPEFKKRIELSNEINELKMFRDEYNHETSLAQKKLQQIPTDIEIRKSVVADIKEDKKSAEKIKDIELTLNNGKKITDKKEVNSYLLKMVQDSLKNANRQSDMVNVGDFKIFAESHGDSKIRIIGKSSYSFNAGTTESQDNYQRLANFFEKTIDKRETETIQSIERLTEELQQAEVRANTPFPQEEELENKIQEFNELDEKLSGLSEMTDDIYDAEEVDTILDEKEIESIEKFDDDDFVPEEKPPMHKR